MGLNTIHELTDDELERIERRSEAATLGPWFSYVAGRDSEADSNYIELGSCNELGSCSTMELVGATIADQEFIAAAREDVPRLLFEVRMLKARVRALCGAEIDAEHGEADENIHVSGAGFSDTRDGREPLR
jgi:hypothetical protein